MDYTVHGVTKRQTRLSNLQFHLLISLSLIVLTFMKSNHPVCLEEKTKSLHLVPGTAWRAWKRLWPKH